MGCGASTPAAPKADDSDGINLPPPATDRETTLKELFVACDCDNSGTLDVAEFKSLAASQHKSQLKMQEFVFAMADENGDSTLSVDEFVKHGINATGEMSDEDFKGQAASWQSLAILGKERSQPQP